MPDDEIFNAPDADVILRSLGPPNRDFRVHKIVLSLASSVFKDMFSLPKQISEDSGKPSSVGEIEIVGVTDPPDVLQFVLRIIYPFPPPSYDGNLDFLVECLVITDKYDIEGAKARLRNALAWVGSAQSLRVYAIAVRFGFASLAESASNHIVSSVDLDEISELPDDFDFVSATAYHKLVRRRASHLKAAEEVTEGKSSKCSN